MRRSKLFDDERFVHEITSCNELSKVIISHSGGFTAWAPKYSLTINGDGLITYSWRNPAADSRIRLRVSVSDINDAMNALRSLKNVVPDLIIIEDVGTYTIKAKCDGHIKSMQSDVIPSWMGDFLSMIKALFEERYAEIPCILQEYDGSKYRFKRLSEKIEREIEQHMPKD